MAYKDLVLTLDNQSTYQSHTKDGHKLSQLELEERYKKAWKRFQTQNKRLPQTEMWKAFQEKNGVLLIPDRVTGWGDGKPMFKARFTKSGEFTTSASVSQQVRNWRVKFLTDGSPGTKLALADTAKQFFNDKTNLAKQIHHIEGIAELSPFIDDTIKKILRGDKAGMREYKAFYNHSHKYNLIYGDKVENYAALTRNQHINVPGSAHIRQGELGDAFITRSSGGSAFDLGFDSDTPIRNTRANLSKLPREGISFNKRGRAVQNTNTIWDAMAEYSAVTSEGRVSAISKALKSQKETRSSLPTPNRRKPKGSSTVQKLIDQGIDESKAWDMYKAIDKAEGINNWINLFRKWELSNAAWTGRKLGATIPVAGAGFAGWGLIDNVKEAAVNPTKHNILKAGGSFVETTGEVVSAGGILAAPFTKGLSLGLVPVGEGIAAVGSGTEISTVLHENKEAIKQYASDVFQDKNLPKIRGRSGAKRAMEAKKLEQKQLQARFSPPPEQTTIPFVPSPEQEEWYWQGVSSTPWLR